MSRQPAVIAPSILAADFVNNPFSTAFQKVDKAVATKQAFETGQIKQAFHSEEAKTNMDGVFQGTETEHAVLAHVVAESMTPVRHTILIQAVP